MRHIAIITAIASVLSVSALDLSGAETDNTEAMAVIIAICLIAHLFNYLLLSVDYVYSGS